MSDSTEKGSRLYWDYEGHPCVTERECPGCGKGLTGHDNGDPSAVITDGTVEATGDLYYYDGVGRTWDFDLKGLAPGRLAVRCTCGHALTFDPAQDEDWRGLPPDSELDAIIDRARESSDQALRGDVFRLVRVALAVGGELHRYVWLSRLNAIRDSRIYDAVEEERGHRRGEDLPETVERLVAELRSLRASAGADAPFTFTADTAGVQA